MSVQTFGGYSLTTVVTDPPYFENCYIVRHMDSGDQVIVDPGSAAERIIAQAQADGGTVKAILLTHGHPDHMGAAHALQQEFGVPVHAHRDENAIIAELHQWSMALLGQSLPAPQDVQLFDGEPDLELGQVRCKAIYTPGHTPGGVTFAFDGFALTGDTLFQQGVGRTDFPGGDHGQLVSSITRLLQQLPDDSELFAGHGGSWTAAHAKRWWPSSPYR